MPDLLIELFYRSLPLVIVVPLSSYEKKHKKKKTIPYVFTIFVIYFFFPLSLLYSISVCKLYFYFDYDLCVIHFIYCTDCINFSSLPFPPPPLFFFVIIHTFFLSVLSNYLRRNFATTLEDLLTILLRLIFFTLLHYL